MTFKLMEIKQGDILKCLNCGKPIKISDETFKMDFAGEYVDCPNCKCGYDALAYHKYGEKV